MRPILALAITIFLLGGVFAYTQFADSVRRSATEYHVDFSRQEYSVEIRKTFAAAPDPIFGADSMKVKFKGETILSRADEVPAEETIEIRPLEGVEVGENELFISVNRQSTEAALAVVLVTVKEDDIPVAESTLAGVPGLPIVSGTVLFVATKTNNDEPNH
jgi:hypothetical protein